MKKILFLLLSIVLMSSYASSASVVVESRELYHPKNYSIMYMKDGEPVDKHADQKLLYSLWKELFILDIQFKFVGPDIVDTRIGKMNYTQLSEDSKSCNKAERLEKLVAEYQPDIVLLDIVKCDDTLKSDYSKSWASVITDMLQANSNVKIILSKTGLGSEYVSHIAGLPMTSGMPSNDRILWVDSNITFESVHKKQFSDNKSNETCVVGEKAKVWADGITRLVHKTTKAYTPQIYSYKAIAEGDSLTLHVFEDRKLKTASVKPAIVFFFGGGWSYGTPLQFYRECSYYASKGYVAIAVDYRINFLHHTTPFHSFDDAKDAIRWIKKHAQELHVDSTRIVAAGASAGGQLAAALGTVSNISEGDTESYIPDLLLLYYPVIDNSPQGYGPKLMKDNYQKISPLHNINSKTPPTLLLVGTKDQYVPVETCEAYKAKMDSLGIDCELHLFEDLGHPLFLYREPLTSVFYEIRKYTDAFLQKHGYY